MRAEELRAEELWAEEEEEEEVEEVEVVVGGWQRARALPYATQAM